MKNRIYIVSLALLAMVSCVNDDIVQTNKGQEIGFRTSFDTRATELTATNLSGFYVTALTTGENAENYFTNVYFTKDNNSVFTASGDYKYYWPASNELDFYAYYPQVDNITIEPSTKVITGYTPNEDISSQQDLVYAKTRATKSASVHLNFEHALSQVGIVAKNENTGYVIKVKSVRIKNVVKSGDFNIGTGVWNPSNDVTSYEIVRSAEETDEPLSETQVSLMSDKGNAMLIPATTTAWAKEVKDESTGEVTTAAVPDGSYIAFLVQVNTAEGVRIYPAKDDADEYGWVAKPMAFDWAAGYKYIYVCDFSNGLGVVAPEEAPEEGGNTGNGNPGDEVYGSKIAVEVAYTNWISGSQSGSSENIPMGDNN